MSFRDTFILICVTLALACTGGAADKAVKVPGENVPIDFQTRDGQAFNNVTARRVSGRTLEVKTEKGTQLLPFTNLPVEIQERFFDPSMLHPPAVGDLLDFKTRDGRHYKGKLVAITPNGLTVEIPDGIEKIPYASLPPELANNYDFDAQDAAAYEREQQRLFAARLAAELAEQKKALKGTPKPGRSSSRGKETTPVPLGESGRQQLGIPKLGGSGLGK